MTRRQKHAASTTIRGLAPMARAAQPPVIQARKPLAPLRVPLKSIGTSRQTWAGRVLGGIGPGAASIPP